jgi:hypothetical protein
MGKVTDSNFKFQVIENLSKYEMELRPTCQPQLPLNRPHQSLARASATPHVVTRWWRYTNSSHHPWIPCVLIPYATSSRSMSFLPPLSTPCMTLLRLPTTATSTHYQLARARGNHPSIHSAPSFAKGSQCFCPRLSSTRSTSPTTSPHLTATLCWAPVSSPLRGSHRR